jgi:cytidine deaminase
VTPGRAGAAALDERLREAAFRAMENAYAPYSGFRVGAAVAGEDGVVVAGCNVENSAYPSGICAERGAVAALVAGGGRRVRALVIATEADDPTPPCGMCRQVLGEFADADLEVVSATRSGREARWRMGELLPAPFTPASLGRH